MKLAIGLLLGLGIGLGCRWLGIPAPAPPFLQGALLVMAMTAGYQFADRWLTTRTAQQAHNCGGPSGNDQGGAS